MTALAFFLREFFFLPLSYFCQFQTDLVLYTITNLVVQLIEMHFF